MIFNLLNWYLIMNRVELQFIIPKVQYVLLRMQFQNQYDANVLAQRSTLIKHKEGLYVGQFHSMNLDVMHPGRWFLLKTHLHLVAKNILSTKLGEVLNHSTMVRIFLSTKEIFQSYPSFKLPIS